MTVSERQERLEWLDLSQPEPDPAPASTPTPIAPAEPPLETLPAVSLPKQAPILSLEPPPETWFNPESLAPPHLYTLRLHAETFSATTGFDHLICLDDISIDHHRYQLEAALRVLRNMRGRALLGDEVGLGKTIEAGIIMKELLERRLAQRVLIVTPAALTGQWQAEMAAKFHENFTLLEDVEQLPPASEQPAAQPCRWLISLARARVSPWRERLLAAEYDLLIVDEAHKLKNHRTRSYSFVDQIRKRYVLLLTATPVHNNLEELYNLITILRPGHLGSRSDFRERYINLPPSQQNRLASRRTIFSRATPPPYLKKNTTKRTADRQKWPEGYINGIKRRTESLHEFRQDYLPRHHSDTDLQTSLAEVQDLQASGYDITEFEGVEWRNWYRSYADFVCRLKLRPADERPDPEPAERPPVRNAAALRYLLGQVMVRNRRSQVGVRLPRRTAAIYHLNFSPAEAQLYQQVTAYIRRKLYLLQEDHISGRERASWRFRLVNLQKQLTSSPQAIARSLKNLLEHEAAPALSDSLALAESIPTGRKIKAIHTILSQFPGKFLIFTDYLPTLNALLDSLTAADISCVAFHGGLDSLGRVEAVRQFRNSARVMVSTRSGGEGHNLQFCHQLINLDLPWNPMQIEQRIGRIHRLGQKEAVSIFNLSINDTLEASIIDLLAHKIRMFELVIGELDLILGELEEEQSLADLIESAWADSYTEAEVQAKIAALEGVIGQAQTLYESARASSSALDDILEAV